MPFTFFTFLTNSRESRARTILGWTPGLRTLVGGRVLPCGCLMGIYDTWGGEVAAIVDAPGEGCANDQHHEHAVLWRRRGVQELLPIEEPTP